MHGGKTYTQVKTAATQAVKVGASGTFTVTLATAAGGDTVAITAKVNKAGAVTFATAGGGDVTARIGTTATKTPTMASVASGTAASTVTISIAGKKFDTGSISIAASDTSATIASKVAAAIANKIGTGNEVEINGVKCTVAASAGKLTFSQVNMPETTDEARANFDVSISIKNADANDTGKTLSIQLTDPKTSTVSSQVTLDMSASIKAGTYVSNPGVAKADANKANTIFEIKESDLTDGTQFAIGTMSVVLKVGNSQVKTADYPGAKFVELDEGTDLNTALSKISEEIGPRST